MNSGLVVLLIGGLLLVALLVLIWPTPRSRTKAGTPAVFRDEDRYWNVPNCSLSVAVAFNGCLVP